MYRPSLPKAAPTVLSGCGAVMSGRPVPPSTWNSQSLGGPAGPPLVRDATRYLPSGVHSGETYVLLFPG